MVKTKEKSSKKELKKLAEAIKEKGLVESLEKQEESPKELKESSSFLEESQTKEKLIQETKFIESPIKVEDFSPSLKPVQTSRQDPEISDLEQVASSFPLQEKPKDKEDFGYTANPEEKYHKIAEDYRSPESERIQKDENLIVKTSMERIDMQTVGRDLNRPPESISSIAPDLEKFREGLQDPNYLTTEKTLEEAKNLPFGHEEKKYKIH